MKATAPIVAVLCTAGLTGCSGLEGPSAPCSMLVPLLTVGNPLGNPPGPPEAIKCCGDAKQYAVTQHTNDIAVGIAFQAVATANGGAITGLRLSVAIVHCEAAAPGDCAPVADQTTPNIAEGAYQIPPYPVSQAHPGVSGRNIRLALTVSNDQSNPSAFYLYVDDVTPGPQCQSF